jgi:hypothetical protein
VVEKNITKPTFCGCFEWVFKNVFVIKRERERDREEKRGIKGRRKIENLN